MSTDIPIDTCRIIKHLLQLCFEINRTFELLREIRIDGFKLAYKLIETTLNRFPRNTIYTNGMFTKLQQFSSRLWFSTSAFIAPLAVHKKWHRKDVLRAVARLLVLVVTIKAAWRAARSRQQDILRWGRQSFFQNFQLSFSCRQYSAHRRTIRVVCFRYWNFQCRKRTF